MKLKSTKLAASLSLSFLGLITLSFFHGCKKSTAITPPGQSNLTADFYCSSPGLLNYVTITNNTDSEVTLPTPTDENSMIFLAIASENPLYVCDEGQTYVYAAQITVRNIENNIVLAAGLTGVTQEEQCAVVIPDITSFAPNSTLMIDTNIGPCNAVPSFPTLPAPQVYESTEDLFEFCPNLPESSITIDFVYHDCN